MLRLTKTIPANVGQPGHSSAGCTSPPPPTMSNPVVWGVLLSCKGAFIPVSSLNWKLWDTYCPAGLAAGSEPNSAKTKSARPAHAGPSEGARFAARKQARSRTFRGRINGVALSRRSAAGQKRRRRSLGQASALTSWRGAESRFSSWRSNSHGVGRRFSQEIHGAARFISWGQHARGIGSSRCALARQRAGNAVCQRGDDHLDAVLP